MSGEGPGARELIPILDLLQHGAFPSMEYHGEGLEHGLAEPCTVARATRHLCAGEEIFNSYGEHPDYIFATHFGFVPSDANGAAAGLCTCVLSLAGSVEDRIGMSIALAAQARATNSAAIELDDAPTEVMDGQRKMALLLAEADAWASYPLAFAVSNEAIDRMIADAAAGRMPTNKHGAAALVASARLCAFEVSDLNADGDPNAQMDEVLQRLVASRDGRLSRKNDIRAAELVTTAARARLAQLEKPVAVTGPATRQAAAACVRLAQEVRRSEVLVLRRLARSDVTELIFSGTPQL